MPAVDLAVRQVNASESCFPTAAWATDLRLTTVNVEPLRSLSEATASTPLAEDKDEGGHQNKIHSGSRFYLVER